MTNDILLLKLGEIVLKGLNRRAFETRLMMSFQNIANFMKTL